MLAATLLLLAAAAGLYFKSRAAQVATDAETLCPLDRAPSAITAVLIDVSDSFSEPQRIAILNKLRAVQNAVPRFGRVEVYALGHAEERLIRPVLVRCNPGTGEDMNALYQNPSLARRKWEEAFSQVLTAAFERLLNQPDSTKSLIFEAVQAVALRTFGAPEFAGVPKELVVFSDLIQHNPGTFSQYSGPGTFAAFADTAYAQAVRADLQGVEVQIFYLNRETARGVQGRKHLSFWIEFLESQRATVTRVERIYG